MKFRILIYLSMVVVLGCRGNIDYEYYPNGNIKRKIEKKDGKRHGTLIEYYEDGSISKEQHWKNGIVEGTFIDYYPDGSIYRKGEVENNKMVSYKIYHSTGVLHQIHHFDSVGNLMELELYNQQGERDSIAYYDFQLFPRDTVEVGEFATFRCTVFNRIDPVYEKGELLITSAFDTTRFGLMPRDTIALIVQNNFTYEYQLLPTNIGKHEIYGVFIHIQSEDAKTRTVVAQEFGYPYFVVDK